jgi:hypothetical protein
VGRVSRYFRGGTLPGPVQRSGLFDRIHRAIPNCPKVHLRDDYERQAGFWEGHDSYECTYDWLPPLALRKIRFSPEQGNATPRLRNELPDPSQKRAVDLRN